MATLSHLMVVGDHAGMLAGGRWCWWGARQEFLAMAE
jgi:hypothetical protein